jgi:trimeric autotransporter adhesin
MKHLFPLNARWHLIALTFLVFIMSRTASAQLSGTYTIGGSGASYSSFSAAVSDLTSKGVTGAVVFKIANGTYTEQVSIGNISGASATNTITFQSASADSSKVILTDTSSASSTNNYTLQLNKSRFVIIKQICITRTGAKANAVVVNLAGNTNNCKLLNNLLIGKLDPSTASLGIVSGNAVILSTGSDTSDLIDGNRIKLGYCGVAFNSYYEYNNTVSNNIIDTAGMAGVYCASTNTGTLISGNTFNMGPIVISGVTHYVSYGIRFETGTDFNIVKNRFYSTSAATVCRCITLFGGSSSTGKRNLLANNFAWVSAGSSSSTGITLGGNANLDVVYNNVLMTSIPSSSAALYVYPQYTGSSNVIENNNLINLGSGTAIDNSNSSTSYTTGVTVSNYNNLYTKGSYIGNYKGTKYGSLTAWLATGFDSSSVNVDPGYASNTDLHVSSAAINGKAIPFSAVTDDIDGDARSSTVPDIGADEFTPLAKDAGITILDSPTVFCSPISKNIVVKFTNFGTDTLKTLDINWSVNGVAQTSYSWSGSVALGNISSQVNIGSYNFSSTSTYVLKIWTSAPNSGTDQKNTNDTLTKVIGSGLSGTYTIGGSSPDFSTINAALDAITLRGLCGATIFNLRNGTYAEQITIPAYNDLSAANTLTFQSESGDSSKVIISLGSVNANGVNNVVVQSNGARYLTFKNLTIMRTGAGIYQGIVEIKNKSNNISFINNRFIGVLLASSNSSADIIQSAADKDTSILFKNNLFKYGNAAINISGDAASHETNNIIDGNTIDSAYTSGIIATYDDGIIIRNNNITNINAGNSSYYGIFLSTCNNYTDIHSNRIVMPYGGLSGIYLNSCNGGSGTGLVYNNYVSIGKGSSTPYGIYNSSTLNQDYYFNTVNIYNTNTGSAFYTNTASSGIVLENNILANNGGGFAITATTATSPFSNANYNDLYTSGTKIGSYNGSSIADLSAWKTATSMSAQSVSTKPYFYSSTDFHTANLLLKSAGTPISGISTDIVNKSRNASTPSIGAYEIVPAQNEAGISAITAPSASICPGSANVSVTLKNSGSLALNSATINWTVNGTAQLAYSYSGTSIAANSTATVSIGSYVFATGSVIIKAWSSNPNGTTDSFPGNDTFQTTIVVNSLPAAAAGSNSSVCPGSSIQIGATAVTGSTYSWASVPSGFTSTSANPSVTPSVATTYTVTETNANGCVASNSVTISISTPPAAFAGASVTVCSGNSVQIGGPAVSGNTYSWSSNPSGFSSTSANPFVSPTVTTTYTLTESKSGCNASHSVTITVNPLPAANAGSNVAICNGSSTTIGSSPVTGNTYYWTTLSSTYTSTSSNPTVSPSSTTTYVLQETITATGCTNLGAVVVTVNPIPAANTGSGVSICNGGSVQIGGTALSGNTYSWTSNPSGFTSSASNPVVSPTATTVYSLTETNSAGCSLTNTVTITVNGLPTANITTSSTTTCFGNTIGMNITSTGTGYTYKWYENGVLLSGSTGTSYYTTRSGVYTAQVTNPNGCAAISNSITTTVNPLPLANATALGSTTRCSGDSVIMIANTAAGYTYQWSKDGTPVTGATGYKFAATLTGNYQVTVTSASGCSDTATTIPVLFNAPPTAPISFTGTGIICEGQSVTVRTNILSGVSYAWTVNNNSISGATSASYSATTSGNYKVTVTNNVTGCTTTSPAATIVVNAVPVAIIKALGSTKLCAGSSIILSADKNAGYTYQWIKDGAYVGGNFDTLNANSAGNYTVQVTNTNGCNAASSSITVTNNPTPSISIITPSSTSICKGTAMVLHTTNGGNISDYQWILNGNPIPGANLDSQAVSVTGNYSVMVTGTAGCNATTGINITVNDLPVSRFSKPSYNVCSGTNIPFVNKSYVSSGSIHYVWTFGNGDSSKDESPVYAYPAAGKYKIMLMAISASGCASVSVDSVQVLPVNASIFTATHIGFRRMAMLPSDLTGATYTWNFGDNTLGSGQTPVHQYAADGTYQVSLTVSNANGCTTTTVNAVKVDATGINPVAQENLTIKVFPNPFKTSTNVVYTLNQSASIEVDVYDMLGKRVSFVDKTNQPAGEHTFIFNGEKPGTYFIRLIVDGKPYVNKVIQQ